MVGYVLTHPIPDGFEDFGKGPPSLSGSETALYLHDMCVSTAASERGHRPAAVRRAECLHLESEEFRKIVAVAVQSSETFWKKRGFEIGAPYTYPGGAAGHIITKTYE